MPKNVQIEISSYFSFLVLRKFPGKEAQGDANLGWRCQPLSRNFLLPERKRQDGVDKSWKRTSQSIIQTI